MSAPALAVYGAAAIAVVGMMLVVAGVIGTGFFLPGVVLIIIAHVGFAVAALLHATAPRPRRDSDAGGGK